MGPKSTINNQFLKMSKWFDQYLRLSSLLSRKSCGKFERVEFYRLKQCTNPPRGGRRFERPLCTPVTAHPHSNRHGRRLEEVQGLLRPVRSQVFALGNRPSATWRPRPRQNPDDLLRRVFSPGHFSAPLVTVSLSCPLVQNSPVTSIDSLPEASLRLSPSAAPDGSSLAK